MKKIAIIEDEMPLLRMYHMKFEAEGFEVICAKNGKLGLEICQTFRPDIILLDLMMPEMTGDEMLRELRKTDWGKDIKVLIMTNVSRDEAKTDLSNLKIDGYIIKADYTPHQMIDLVKVTLAKKTM